MPTATNRMCRFSDRLTLHLCLSVVSLSALWRLSDTLMSVLGDLQALSAAVMHSSEEGSEEEDGREEGQGDRATQASLLR